MVDVFLLSFQAWAHKIGFGLRGVHFWDVRAGLLPIWVPKPALTSQKWTPLMQNDMFFKGLLECPLVVRMELQNEFWSRRCSWDTCCSERNIVEIIIPSSMQMSGLSFYILHYTILDSDTSYYIMYDFGWDCQWWWEEMSLSCTLCVARRDKQASK